MTGGNTNHYTTADMHVCWQDVFPTNVISCVLAVLVVLVVVLAVRFFAVSLRVLADPL